MNPTLAKAIRALVPDRYAAGWFDTSILSTENYGIRLRMDWRSLPCRGRHRPFVRGTRLVPWMHWALRTASGTILIWYPILAGWRSFPIGYLFGALTREVA